MKIIRTTTCLLLLSGLAACGGTDGGKSAQGKKAGGPDYRRMTQVSQVEALIPPALRASYQSLFNCRIQKDVDQGRTPEITPVFAGKVLDDVRKDPAAGEKCLAAKA